MVVAAGGIVDCRFPLTVDLPLDDWGLLEADLDVSYDDTDRAQCSIEDAELVCRRIVAFYAVGTRTVTPIVSGWRSSATATFRIVDVWDLPVAFGAEWGGEPYVLPGHPLSVYVDGYDRGTAVYATVRSRDDGRAMATVAVPPIDPDAYSANELYPGDLPAGRYVATPCVGASVVTCVETQGGGVGFQVGTRGLVEVIAGWNIATADRINVVFVPSGDITVAAALESIRTTLGWDGQPLALGADDRPVDPAAAEVVTLRFGPFATEPIRSARDRFNLWMVDDVVVDPHALDHTAPPVGWDRPPLDFGLPDVMVTILDAGYPGTYDRSAALWPSFSAPDGPVPLERDGLVFGSAYVVISPYAPLFYGPTLTHEWGHGLFDLRDEYVAYDRGVTYGYPNCAPDRATAQEWWGHLVGRTDPFVREVIEINEQYGTWIYPGIQIDTTVSFQEGGCYSDDPDLAVRPTVDSMMSSEIPVFGPVNRWRVEEILSMWTGRAPFSLDLVSISCEAVLRWQVVGQCGFAVPASVDAPTDPVSVSAGDVRAACSLVVSGSETNRYVCGGVPLVGSGPWTVTLETGAESVVVRPVFSDR